MALWDWSTAEWQQKKALELLKLCTRVYAWEYGHIQNGGSALVTRQTLVAAAISKNAVDDERWVQQWFDAAQKDFSSLDWHMKGWWTFARQAVEMDGRCFYALRPHLRCDPILAQMALEQMLLLGARAHVTWRIPRPFLAALKAGSIQLPLCSILSKDKVEGLLAYPSKFTDELLRIDPRGLPWFGAAVRDSVESMRIAIPGARDCGARSAAAHASWRLRSCPLFAAWVIREDVRSFAFLSPTLQRRRDLLELALRGGYSAAFLFACDAHREDQELLRLALRHGKNWWRLPGSLDPLLLLESVYEEDRVVGERFLRWLLHYHPRETELLLVIIRIWPDLLPMLATRDRKGRFLRQAVLADPHLVFRVDSIPKIEPQVLESRRRACRAGVLPCGLKRKLGEISDGGEGKKVDEDADDGDKGGRRLRSRVCDEMRCPICLDLVSKPVMQCRLGHLMCRECLKNLPRVGQNGAVRCPVCRCEHDGEQSGFSRSLLADALLDEMPLEAVSTASSCSPPRCGGAAVSP